MSGSGSLLVKGYKETAIEKIRHVASAAIWEPRNLFEYHYPSILYGASAMTKPGWLVLLLKENRHVLDISRFELKPGEATFAVVGRHPNCDFRCIHDPTIPRRAAILQLARRADETLTISCLQLGSYKLTMEGIDSARCVRVEGGLCLRAGSYVMWCIPVGEEPFGDNAEQAYHRMSPRTVSVSHTQATSHEESTKPLPKDASETLVSRPATTTTRPVPLPADTVGILRVVTIGFERVVPVTRSRLRTGITIGRLASCDVPVPKSPVVSAVSGIHAVLWQPDDEVLMVDAASSDGIRDQSQTSRREVSLRRDASVCLAPGTQLIWEPLGGQSQPMLAPGRALWHLK